MNRKQRLNARLLRLKAKAKALDERAAASTDAAEVRDLTEQRADVQADIDDVTAEILKRRKYKTINAFYAAIGEGELDVADVKNMILAITQGSGEQSAERYGCGGTCGCKVYAR